MTIEIRAFIFDMDGVITDTIECHIINSKPAPDVFLWVAGRLNVSPAQTVVFEDAPAGIEAALRGGFWTWESVQATATRHT